MEGTYDIETEDRSMFLDSLSQPRLSVVKERVVAHTPAIAPLDVFSISAVNDASSTSMVQFSIQLVQFSSAKPIRASCFARRANFPEDKSQTEHPVVKVPVH